MSKLRRTRTWIIPLIKAVCTQGRAVRRADEKGLLSRDVLPDPEAFDRWASEALAARGHELGMPRDLLATLEAERHAEALEGPAYEAVPYEEYTLYNATAHLLDLGAVILTAAPTVDAGRLPRLLLVALAWHLDRAALIEEAHARVESPDEEDDSRAISALAMLMGEALAEEALRPGDPLLGHPFHQMLLYSEARQFIEVARAVALAVGITGGRPEEEAVYRAHGLARARLQHALSACVALVVVDGPPTETERRWLNALSGAARLSPEEIGMLTAEELQPMAVEALVAEESDPAWRRAIYRLLAVVAEADGTRTEREVTFLDALGGAFGLEEADRALLSLEAVAHSHAHARMAEGAGFIAPLARLKHRLVDSIDGLVRDNADRLWSEVQETSELGQLLVKASQAPLSAEERFRLRDQLLDLARAVPALALFAAPGGSLLLPLLVKHLPFRILPSNFNDQEQL